MTPVDVPPPEASWEARILDAALTLVARWGLTKTTMADVARQAGCGRASVYRAFPGGKDQLFAALGRRELLTFFDRTGHAVDTASSLEDALVIGVESTARFVADHAALQFVLRHEPEVVLPYLAFGQVDRLYRAAGLLAGPHLERFLAVDDASWAAEWIGRIVLSHVFNPTPDLDLTDTDTARRLVRRFLLPALVPEPASPVPSAQGA